MAKRHIIGNWKMNLSATDSVQLARSLLHVAKKLHNTQVGVTPAFPALASVAQIAAGSDLQVGAQNVCGEAKGAFTGEVSVEMLRETGCSFSLVGHSERRHRFGESPTLVARRVSGALEQAFSIVLCVGETLPEREAGRTEQVLDEQLSALEGIRYSNRLIVAYEPFWAIGTGKVAAPSQISSAHAFIASRLARLAGPTPILYGGSVTPANLAEILRLPNVDGALVGGASLSSEGFAELLQIAESV